MATPRRLKGHKRAVTCCLSTLARPGIVVSSGEDGCICWFDLRCKDAVLTIEVGKVPVPSICFKAGNEDVIYAALGSEIKGFDVHLFDPDELHVMNSKWIMSHKDDDKSVGLICFIKKLSVSWSCPWNQSAAQASSWKPLESYNYNKEEINQVAFSYKSSFLAAADDSGDVKIIDTHQQCLYKTLRAVHTSICSSVQFLPWKPWEVITGGLDSKLVKWDFSRGRLHNVVDFGMPDMESCENSSNASQCFNPAFVHAISIPDMEMLGGSARICGVARGDGAVDVIDIESEMAAVKPRNSSQPKKGSQSRSRDRMEQGANAATADRSQGKRLHLDYSLGGHTAAVSCIAFSLFGERGKFIISGGNDALVKIWDWSKYYDAGQNSCNNDFLPLSVDVRKKVNWLCTTPADSENLVVCDTSKVMKVYNIS